MEYERFYLKIHKWSLRLRFCRQFLMIIFFLSLILCTLLKHYLVGMTSFFLLEFHKKYIISNKALISGIYNQLRLSNLPLILDVTETHTFKPPNMNDSRFDDSMLTFTSVTTYIGPQVLRPDNILHIVVTYTNDSIAPLKAEYEKYVDDNKETSYVNADFDSNDIFRIYEYSQIYHVLYLSNELRYILL